jgi:general secretion pathway protein H
MSLRDSTQGFTLIEILVVILIIGITLGFALIAFGDFGEGRRLLFAAEQLANTIELAQQQAILETSTLGLRIDNRGYQILKLQPAQTWSAISNKGIFKMNYFPNNTITNLNLARPANKPAIVINASGETTPFILRLGTTKQSNLVTLIGKANGTLLLSSGQSK